MPVKTKAKAKKKETAKKSPQPRTRKLPAKSKKNQDKSTLPVIDFCGIKLTALRRDFIIHYCTPGQPCFHNAFQAALKAGFSETVAKSDIYGILRDPDIQRIIKTNEDMAHRAIHDAAMRAMELKQRRAFFDPLDYFEKRMETRIKKGGEEYMVETIGLKDLEDMTLEQRLCIDGIDVKGQASIPVYLMADRGKELNDIIKIDAELTGGMKGDSQDVEETKEIIVERVTIRQKRRVTEAAEVADYEIVEPSRAEIEEEL